MNSSNMRLIIAIIRDADSESVLQPLLEKKYRVTRIATTGGFLRRGNTTLLIGVDAEQVQPVIQLIRDNSAPGVDPGIKRATIFSLKVEHFVQFE